MKEIIYLILCITIFSSCNHRIVRTGYQLDKSDYNNCDIAIRKNSFPHDSVATFLGEIKLGDSGVSTTCNEGDAINILKNEGCALNAELIVITDEKRPSVWSSCYRCRAKFYKFNDSTIVINSDTTYNNDLLVERISKDRKKNVGIVIGIVVAAVIFIFLVT